jgi:signal transduction histidine kinase
LKRRNALLFFLVPFLGLFVFFSLASILQQRDLKARTEALVHGQLEATAGIVAKTASRFLDQGMSPEAVLDTVLADEDVYFVALLDERDEILAWSSRFEGYLPLSLSGPEGGRAGTIDSPAGRIFSEMAAVETAGGGRYRLYLGYALTGLEAMITQSRRTSVLLAALILLAGAIFFRGLYLVQSRYLAKSREADAERQEKERFREISAFTSGVAHEIKNPLNSLALVLEILGRKVPEEAKGDVNLGKAQVKAIARIVDRFSRVIKAVRPDLARVSLDALAAQAVENLALEVPAAAARVRLEVPSGLALSADRELLGQALLNVLKNAVEASESAPVRVTGRRTGGRAEIVVRDEGPGFPAEAADRLFEPFYSTKGTGMGIGLYLARKIVEAHGGTIEARRPAGGGSEFRIELPGA